MFGPCTLPSPEAEAEAEAESRRGPRLLRAKTSNPHIDRVSTACAAGILGAVNGTASLTSKPILVHSAAHTPRDSASGALASLAWIGSDAASRKAAQQRAAGCRMCRPQGDRSQVALGCNTVDVVATQYPALLRRTCVAAQRQMSRREAVAAQMSARDRFGCGADVGGGWTLSQGRGGQGIASVQLQMWVGVDLVPVQMWAG